MSGSPQIGPRALRRTVAAGAVYLLAFGLNLPPRPLALRLAKGLGALAWRLDVRGRRTSLTHLHAAFGDRIDNDRAWTLGQSSYRHMAASLADLCRLHRLSSEQLNRLVPLGRETLIHIERGARRGRGIILLTPHLGNWELLAAYLASRGAPVHFVGRDPYDRRLEPLFTRVRNAHGASWIRRGGAWRTIRQALQEGEMVVLLIDQDTRRVQGTFVEFFGRPAWTATGPAVLARETGAILLPAALVHRPDHTYRLLVEPPLRTVATGDCEWDDWENTRRATLALESLIERFPDQWVWFHRRWGTPLPAGWVPPRPKAGDRLFPIRPPNES
jgi:Kdo2-lipid IVA lauroyltransferase/acyltransferase